MINMYDNNYKYVKSRWVKLSGLLVQHFGLTAAQKIWSYYDSRIYLHLYMQKGDKNYKIFFIRIAPSCFWSLVWNVVLQQLVDMCWGCQHGTTATMPHLCSDTALLLCHKKKRKKKPNRKQSRHPTLFLALSSMCSTAYRGLCLWKWRDDNSRYLNLKDITSPPPCPFCLWTNIKKSTEWKHKRLNIVASSRTRDKNECPLFV